jgi:hypothetical protein
LDIVVLVLWALTGAVGLVLLSRVTGAARQPAGSPAAAEAPAPSAAARSAAAPSAAATSDPGPTAVPAPLRAGEPPPVPRVKVHAAPGEHPLLEFSHPLLALVGLACWFAFVFVRFATFASIGLVVLVGTIVAGICLLVVHTRAAGRRRGGSTAARPVPLRLIMLHGLCAVATLALAAFLTVRV